MRKFRQKLGVEPLTDSTNDLRPIIIDSQSSSSQSPTRQSVGQSIVHVSPRCISATKLTSRLLICLSISVLCAIIIYCTVKLVSQSSSPHSRTFDAATTTIDDNFELAPKLPEALIIGARKSGTRALLEALSLHPRVGTARYEVHYFDKPENYEQGIDWYLDQMPLTLRPDQLNIEKTPAYLTDPAVPGRVWTLNRNMKIIVILRDPVVRMISDYSQVHQNKIDRHKPHEPFEKLVFDGQSDTLNLRYKPVRNSLYVQHLTRWLDWFTLSNIHFVDGDRFIENPLVELQKLEKFLELQPRITQDQLYFNNTKGFYCFKSNGISHGSPKCLGDSKGRPHVHVSEETKSRIRRALQPYNQAFFELIGRRFDW